jgi:hypothetical protein
MACGDAGATHAHDVPGEVPRGGGVARRQFLRSEETAVGAEILLKWVIHCARHVTRTHVDGPTRRETHCGTRVEQQDLALGEAGDNVADADRARAHARQESPRTRHGTLGVERQAERRQAASPPSRTAAAS